MKKLGKLKLNQLSKDALDVRLQNTLKGGDMCRCSCSACTCSGWDGTGTMPPGRSSSDMGMGYIGGTSASMRESYL
ncbi:TIGR04149 family rSAM-modified RiPP [Parabacteroides goldsteinii]|uniref:TIGR04149 family rSAM-modified RiPP n=1 Tax=Parabacteroides goldsteinii TaxID=328812 RepID=UPI003C6E2114